jgi:hypothetical protein
MGSLIKQFCMLGRQINATVAVMLSLLLTTAAVAGPPFLTDDPVPVDLHHWEIELSSQTSITRDGTSGSIPLFEFSYGAFPDVQLGCIAPFAYDEPGAGNNTKYGYGDTELGVKWRFVHETDQMPQIAFFPITEIPTGDDNKGLGNGKQQLFLPLWAQKSWGKWTTYGGGGYWLNPGQGNKNYWFTSWLLQRKVAENLMLGGEIFHATPSEEGGDSRTGMNFGGCYDFTENYHLLFSAGRDIEGPNLLISYLAMQITF